MTCDVCKKTDEVGVVSSALGPMSFAICRMCLSNNAEPESSFQYIYEEGDTHGEGIAERVDALSTYSDGHYIPWPQWRDTRRMIEGLEPLSKVNDSA